MDEEASVMDQQTCGSDKDASNDPVAVIGKEVPASEKEPPGDSDMPDAGGNFALFMVQVCLFFFEIQEHLF
jgi:hypothetical protein